MGIRLINYVNNQLQTPALYTDALAQRPTYGIYGRLFMSSDTKEIYQDLATSWQLLADAGAGAGTLQSVCTNGSTTTTGITIQSNNLALTNATSNFFVKSLTLGSVLFSADTSGFVSQDNANFFWDNTNKRLGIGTAAPSAKLDIHSTGINATFNGTGTNNAYLVFQNAGTSKWYVGNLYSGAVANDFVIYDFASSAYRLYIHNTGVVNIPTSLIIGSATPTTSYAFDVTGSGNFSAGLNAGFFNATTSTIPANGMYLSAANTLNFATNTTNRFTISSTGNVSISDTSSFGGQAKLFSRITADATTVGKIADSGLHIWNSTTVGSLSQITFGYTNGSTTNASVYLGLITTNGSGSGFGDFVLGTAPSANVQCVERMRITSGGNVQLTTTTASISFFKTTQNIALSALDNNNLKISNLLSGSGGLSIENLAGIGTRTVLADSTGLLSAPVSDISVKQNIVPIGYGLNEIIKMNPVWYDFIDEYKNNGEGRQNGNIAQEMKEIIPEAVFTTPSTGKMGIEYSQLHAVYIKAIQELNEKLVRNNIN